MADSDVTRTMDRGVLTLTLDRPKFHNALNADILLALRRHLDDAARDEKVRVVVLRATGPNFSAGVDLAHMARLNAMPRLESVEDGRRIGEVLRAVAELPQPTVAALQGPVFGGGLALVAACDIVVAAEEALFSAAEVRLGLTPVLLTPYLAARVGAGAARRLLLTCEKIDAREAYRIGLVDHLAGAEGLDTIVEITVRRLLKAAPGAIAATKRILSEGAALPLTAGAIDAAAEAIATARAGGEAREGVAAFLEKRRPIWADRD